MDDETLCGHILILRKGLPPVSQKCWDCTGYNTHRKTCQSLNCELYTTLKEIEEHEKKYARRNFF